ncbi:nitrate reductase [Blastopirellula sp. J2-11]|uniref:molybdopterin oxidoreductase family protein n=1 Tax=Blastopirellula sp. J2-11 TaxID=2943192 RepID=UPI0021C9ED93|nr:nitrate reductase [Blastopirellula sp. J2-11]UUO09242.1 nitrate reductase [Blastopirellula sp. J2-11]
MVGDIILARDGHLTRQLLLEPAKFGLGKTRNAESPDATTTSVCGFCSTGCGLEIHLKEGRSVNLTPSTDWPVNLGMACPKGWEALNVLQSSDRATRPLRRNPAGELEPTTWDEALQYFCQQMKGVQSRYGNDAVAFLSTGQIATEEMTFLGSLAKFGMGMLHGDGNTRQCMATAATAYKESFGFDAPPFSYADFEESDTLIFVGSNICIAHPILWERVLRNRHQPEIIAIDPRLTETAQAATSHLKIQPKSDLTLLYAVANYLIQMDWIDREFIAAHTNDFASFAAHVESYTIERAVERTGLSEQAIVELAEKIHRGQRVSFWWTMGVNQSHEGVRTAQAIINLALMTGNIGRPGTGANSITGQCNAMGSRLFSNTTNLLGGHHFTNEADRQKVAGILNIPVERIPTENSWAYDQIIEGIRQEKIKGLWVIATNPAHSWIHQNDLQEIFQKLDFLVVQDMYSNTETAQLADLVLPAAAWGEKEGTFINSERRYGLHKKVSPAPGEALADFQIFRAVADYWGCGEMFSGWTEPERVFETMQQLSEGQPCDISGIDGYAELDDRRGVQWPCPTGATDRSVERRLFETGRFYHADEKAKFIFEDSRRPGETVDEEFPFVLLTGRGTAAQWHTQTRTAKSSVLRKLYPNVLQVDLHPTDAKSLGISPHELIHVESRRGTVQAHANLTAAVQRGQVFMPMHWETVNQLTFAEFDPYSRQPSYKNAAVRLRRRQDV